MLILKDLGMTFSSSLGNLIRIKDIRYSVVSTVREFKNSFSNFNILSV